MISGIFSRNKRHNICSEWLRKKNVLSGGGRKEDYHLCDGQIGFSYFSKFNKERKSNSKPIFSKIHNVGVLFTGKLYNKSELEHLAETSENNSDSQNTSRLILNLFIKFGIDFVKKINGKYALAIWDKPEENLYIVRDHLGIEPLYYYIDNDIFVFSSSIFNIFRLTKKSKNLNIKAIGKYLLFNYNPGLETMFEGVFRLRPAHILTVNRDRMKINRYWKLSFKNVWEKKSEMELAEELLAHLRDAVHIRMKSDSQLGVFLSGGMDSSTVLALCAELSKVPLKTFSYRCRSDSFDESIYAKYMANSAAAEHYECEYSPEAVFAMPDIVKKMNEPFCDIGINIATHILGKLAKQHVSHVFTGDGGDELFGGHPVYEADKVGSLFDAVPSFVKNPIIRFFSQLPDSDKKKNLLVKARRFAESFNFPSELLSHRWRIYYGNDELFKLLNSSVSGKFNCFNLFDDILKYNLEADGPDLLSKALYSDYQTAVDFYLRRNDLNRSFSIESHYPLLDHRLVEFCALIPSKMKIAGWFDSKYILKKTMEKVLPHKIIYRKDKLGHSIPLKNWIRENKKVNNFLLDFLSEKIIKRRNLFKPEYVYTLVEEHMAKKRNNSHRLWALAVLELWMGEHLDK
jgi:asparagine synthase (glutamine-hydrolysing)